MQHVRESKICWIPGSTSQNFPDSGFRNPLLGREVTLSGNLPTKQEYILYSKLSSTIWTLHGKIFWKKILILENNLIIKSRISKVLSPLKANPSGHLPSNLNLARFIHFLKMASASVQHCSVEEAGVAKSEKCRWVSQLFGRTDSLFKDLKSWDKFVLRSFTQI